ncbi:TNF receptor-associated factor 6-like [Zophobas morio]|uniref:TNF receptor-associated factor 6-like n=1 Tax=Zophobas morio TaxID=2755281 RepID=UPI00308396AD
MAYDYTDLSDEFKEFICSICAEPFLDPVDTSCGHTFCKKCITHWLEVSRKCPQDNKVLLDLNLLPTNRIIRNQANKFKVYCFNKSKGCTFQDQRQLIHSHYLNECSFTEFRCPFENDGCKATMTRPFINSHIQICSNRRIQCECSEMVSFQDYSVHRERQCPSLKVKCSYCGVLVQRIDEPSHSTTCPEYRVTCRFVYCGCTFFGPRKFISHHLKESCYYNKVEGLCNEVLELRKFKKEILKLLPDLKKIIRLNQNEATFENNLRKLKYESFIRNYDDSDSNINFQNINKNTDSSASKHERNLLTDSSDCYSDGNLEESCGIYETGKNFDHCYEVFPEM